MCVRLLTPRRDGKEISEQRVGEARKRSQEAGGAQAVPIGGVAQALLKQLKFLKLLKLLKQTPQASLAAAIWASIKKAFGKWRPQVFAISLKEAFVRASSG